MEFTKMHGLGNDFIIIEHNDVYNYESLAKKLCDRHLGVGADGLLIVKKSNIADIKMRIFNSDGSEAEMCGNGIRCFAKYVYERGIVKEVVFKVETLAGLIEPKVTVCGGIVTSVRVNMGKPLFDKGTGNMNIYVGDRVFNLWYVNMGVPHVVIFVDEIKIEDILRYGPMIEHHELFPNGTNVNFVHINDKKDITIRTWERGAGLTLACGTGACASCVISNKSGQTERNINVHLAVGDLNIEIAKDGDVYMTGPAHEVFTGIINLTC